MPENKKLKEFKRIRLLFVAVNLVLALALIALILVVFA
jgi:hypothetical protein